MSKKTRFRECPAAGRPISAVECGEGRHVKYACPEACPYNPFSAERFEQYLELEDRATAKTLSWAFDHNEGSDLKIQLAERRQAGLGPAFFHCVAWNVLYRRNSQGRTLLESFEEAGFPGLNNDERTVMRCRMRTRPVFFEVHRVLNGLCLEGVDLLDPARTVRRVVDHVLAPKAARFDVYGVHLTPLPGFEGVFGQGERLTRILPFGPEEVIYQIVQHLGAKTDEPSMRRWLAEHFEEFDQAVAAVASARRHEYLKDAEKQWSERIYELKGAFEECRALLDGMPGG